MDQVTLKITSVQSFFTPLSVLNRRSMKLPLKFNIHSNLCRAVSCHFHKTLGPKTVILSYYVMIWGIISRLSMIYRVNVVLNRTAKTGCSTYL